MARSVYDLQGYAIALDKVLFVTRIFEAPDDEGYQFNVRFSEDVRLTPKYPSRSEAELQRGLLLKAWRES